MNIAIVLYLIPFDKLDELQIVGLNKKTDRFI